MRYTRLVSCLAIVGTLVGLAGSPASAADPTVSATPNTDLADGQQVSVSASGFAPNTFMAVVQCPTTTISPGTCDLDTVIFVTTDSNGAYTDVPFTVSRILGDGTDCALNGGCYIGTQDADAVGPTASTLITFDPNIPPRPPLEVLVWWDKTPKVNEKGVVALKGTVVCKNRGTNVEIDAELSQIVDRAIFRSFGFTVVSCAADTKNPFRITVRPDTGIFGPGPAILRFAAFAGNTFQFRRVALELQPRLTTAAGTSASASTSTVPSLTWR